MKTGALLLALAALLPSAARADKLEDAYTDALGAAAPAFERVQERRRQAAPSPFTTSQLDAKLLGEAKAAVRALREKRGLDGQIRLAFPDQSLAEGNIRRVSAFLDAEAEMAMMMEPYIESVLSSARFSRAESAVSPDETDRAYDEAIKSLKRFYLVFRSPSFPYPI